MSLVVSTAAEKRMIGVILNAYVSENAVLRLFTNNKTPGPTDTEASFTEVSGGGYAAITLAGASWVLSNGDASYPEQTFTFNSYSANVYGYFVTQETSGKLLWAERFTAAPYGVANDGDTIKVTPRISLI